MKTRQTHTLIAAALSLAAVNLYSPRALAQWSGPESGLTTWTQNYYDREPIAFNMALSNDAAAGGYTFAWWTYSSNWAPFNGGSGTAIATDTQSNVWIVNNAGSAYFGYTDNNGRATDCLDPVTGDCDVTWFSMPGNSAGTGFLTIAAGAPYAALAYDVWATDTAGRIWYSASFAATSETNCSLYGESGDVCLVPGEGWTQTPALPNGASAKKVALFNEPLSTTSPGSNCGAHTPWALDTLFNLYEYRVPANESCAHGTWVQNTTGYAYDITANDFIVGTNEALYWWKNSGTGGAWQSIIGDSSPNEEGIVFIGSQDGLSTGAGSQAYGVDGSGRVWFFDQNTSNWP